MSSTDLLKLINQARKDFGEKPVRLNDFNSRIADELSDDHYESFVVQNTKAYLKNMDCSRLKLRQLILRMLAVLLLIE